MCTLSPLRPCLVIPAVVLLFSEAPAQGVFIRGDCNQDLLVNITDPITLLSYLFVGGGEPPCLDACDGDDTGILQITDGIYALTYLFLGGGEPPAPFPLEDPDPTDDALGCANGRDPPFELRVLPRELLLHGAGASRVLEVLAVEQREGGEDAESVRLSDSTRYTSSNRAVVLVSAEGIATAQAAGEASVAVRYRGLARTVAVRVAPAPGESPLLSIHAPRDGSVVTAASVDVAGFVTDPQAALQLDGAELANDAGRFRKVVDLEPGENRIEVVAEGDGGTARASVTVTRADPGSPEAVGPDGLPLPVVPLPVLSESDNTPPVVTITSPAAGAVLLAAAVDVTCTLDDSTAVLRVNGVLAALEGGVYRARVGLQAGEAHIVAEAVDPVGNRGRDEIAVTVDDARLRLTLSEPAGPLAAVVGASPFTVRGTVDSPAAQVVVNGVLAERTGSSWSVDLALDEGLHDLVVTAFVAGTPARSAQLVRAVAVDLSPPLVEIVFPPPEALASPSGFRVSGPSVRFAGRVAETGVPAELAGPVQVMVGGVEAAVAGGTFAAEVPVDDGVSTVELVATDARGHVARKTCRCVREAPDGPSLAAVSGDGQDLTVGEMAAEPLVVSVRNAAGEPDAGVPVTFRVAAGDGVLDDGSRVRTRLTGADGRASATFTAGSQAGAAGLVVTASAARRIGSPVAFVASTQPSTGRVLAAHGRRRLRGAAGEALLRPVEARLLDDRCNPVAGEDVVFEVVEGTALVNGGAAATVATDAAGLASAGVQLPEGNSRSVIEARSAGAAPVRYTAGGLAGGPAADTAVAGSVLDTRGQPVAGMRVRIPLAGTFLQATTDASGSFRIRGAPSGDVLLEIEPPQSPPSRAGLSARVVAVSGRENRLEAPLRVLDPPARPGAGAAEPRSRSAFVSAEEGAVLTLAAVSGARLEIAPGSAVFPGGERSGTVTLLAPDLSAFPAPSPDDISVDVALAILPEGVRFDPPARLLAPAPRSHAGAVVPLVAYFAPAAGWIELPGGVVGEDGIVALEGPRALRRGGLLFFSRPGPRGGRTGTITGRVSTVIPAWQEVPQRGASRVVGANVYAHSGEFFLEETDLELPVPGRGLPFVFRRRYESRHNFRGSLGWNWEHEYEDRRLYPALGGGNVVRATGTGRFDEYLHDASTGRFVSPIGVFARLFVGDDGFFVEREPDGTRYRYHPLDGSVLAGRLASIRDRRGNHLEFLRDGRGLIDEARDTVGRLVIYHHDGEGRIEDIEDFSGRKVSFEYDERGDLVAATTPAVTGTPAGNNFPDGNRTEYVYSSGFGDGRLNHNLQAIIDPRQVSSSRIPRLQIFYEEDVSHPDVDRVVSQIVGGENSTGVPAGGTVSLAYDYLASPAPDPVDAASVEAFLTSAVVATLYTDAEGRLTEVTSSGAGLPLSERIYTVEGLRPRDPTTLHPPPAVAPPYYETRWDWTRDGLLWRRIEPRGDRVEYVYDDASPIYQARSRVVRTERYPAASGGGDQEPLVATFRRDPLCGIAVEETAEGEADRVTRRFLDYQEGTELSVLAAENGVEEADLADAFSRSGIALGLGDLNGDGVVGQAAGNVVKEVPPPVTLPDGTVVESEVFLAYNRFGQITSRTDETGRTVRFEYHPEADPDGDGNALAEDGLDTETGGFLARRIVDAGSGETSRDLVEAAFSYDARGYPASRTDGNGNIVYLVFNSLGRLVEERLAPPLRYRRHYLYDADGNLAGLRVENYTSTDGGTSFLVSDNRWIDTILERDILGRVVTITREVSEGEVGPARSIVTRCRYHPAGALARVIHPVAATEETWEYDERNLAIHHTLAAGTADEAVFTTLRDEAGHVVLSIGAADADGDGEREVEERRYDGFGRLVAVIDPAGGARVFRRSGSGRIEAESFLGSPGGPTPSGRAGQNNVLLRRTSLAHDERGRIVEKREAWFPSAAGVLVTRWFRDGAGRVVRRVDPDGTEHIFDYDNAGRLEREESSRGTLRALTLDGNGNVVRERREYTTAEPVQPGIEDDPDYDESGRFREVENIVRKFDARNRITLLVDGAGGVWRARYDSSDNLIFVSDAGGSSVGAAADPELAALEPLLEPEQLARLNDHGNRRRYVYDNLGRLVEARHELRRDGQGGGPVDVENPFNPDGIIRESFAWDDNGRLEAWTDDNGNRTELRRDGAGYVREKIWPDGTVEEYAVNRDGDPTEITDANGSKILQRFDGLHRVIERSVERAPGVEGTTRQVFEYDGLSRATFSSDDNDPDDPADDAFVARRFDSLGNTLEETAGGFSAAAAYDAASRVVSIRYPDGLLVETPRDASGRVASIADGSGVHASYRRFGSGLLLEARLRPGIHVSFLRSDAEGVSRRTPYDPAGEILEQVYEDSATAVACGFEYGRDRGGFPLYEKPLHAAGEGGDVARGTVWRYDSVYRIQRYLPNVFDPRFPPDDPLEKTVFFGDGNHSWRLVQEDFSDHVLTTNERSAYATSDGETFQYDPAGDLTGAGALAFVYDAFRRLVRVEREGEDVARYSYDACGCEDAVEFRDRGRRVRKEVLRPAGGQPSGVVRHLYLGGRILEDRGPAAGVLRQYLYGDGRAPAAFWLHDGSSSPAAHYLLGDASGSVRAVVDGSGAVEERIRYGAYGKPRIRREGGLPVAFSTAGNVFAFGGNYHDFELGSYLVGTRRFDPQLGRYLTPSSRRAPAAPLRLNEYVAGGLPGLAGEVAGSGSRRRKAEYLQPFRVQLGKGRFHVSTVCLPACSGDSGLELRPDPSRRRAGGERHLGGDGRPREEAPVGRGSGTGPSRQVRGDVLLDLARRGQRAE